MGDKLTEKTVSPKEVGDSEKVTKEAGDESPATLDSAEPGDSSSTTSIVGELHFEFADSDEVDAAIAKSVARNKLILDYLKDK